MYIVLVRGFQNPVDHFFQRLQATAYIVQIYLVGDRSILLSGKPYQHHSDIILHILSGKMRFELQHFIVDGLDRFTHHLFIFWIDADPVSAVSNYEVEGYEVVHIVG